MEEEEEIGFYGKLGQWLGLGVESSSFYLLFVLRWSVLFEKVCLTTFSLPCMEHFHFAKVYLKYIVLSILILFYRYRFSTYLLHVFQRTSSSKRHFVICKLWTQARLILNIFQRIHVL